MVDHPPAPTLASEFVESMGDIIQYCSVKLKSLNFVGWVEELNPIFPGLGWVKRSETQPTNILNRAVLPSAWLLKITLSQK
ncbi:MAG: hypothetical protein V7K38_02685 [Nostoc sp.]|uniref:hypothetical protein n=1 Tax=Nostoc sp. TaxID=1180 RepID=UPI002FFCA438